MKESVNEVDLTVLIIKDVFISYHPHNHNMIVWMIRDKYIFYHISWVIRQSFFLPKQFPIPSKTIPKNLDPSYKMDLDLLGLFRKGKTCFIAKKTHGIDLYL